MSQKLSEDVLALLRASGWTPERAVPVDRMRQAVNAEGIVLHAVAEEVLGSLGGLTLRGVGGRTLVFDSIEACRWIDSDEDWPYIQKLFSPSACPVASGEGMLYFVSEEGRWISLHEGWTVCYFLPDLDSTIRFAVLGGDNFQSRQPSPEELPPGYRGNG